MSLTLKNLIRITLTAIGLFLVGCGYNLRGSTPIPSELFPIEISGTTPSFILHNSNYIWVQKILQEDLQKLNLTYKKNIEEQRLSTKLFFETQRLTKDELVLNNLEDTSILTLTVFVSAKNKFNNLVWDKLEFSSRTKYIKPKEALNLLKSEQEIVHKLALNIVKQIKLRLTKFEEGA